MRQNDTGIEVARQDKQAAATNRTKAIPRTATTVDLAYMIAFGMATLFVLSFFIWG